MNDIFHTHSPRCQKPYYRFYVSILLFSIVSCIFVNNSFANSDTYELILQDVQDKIDTIDQAGLYVLLNSLGDPDINNTNLPAPDPKLLLSSPKEYRGTSFNIRATIDTNSFAIKPGRDGYDNICYVNAQIFTNPSPSDQIPDDKCRYPVIIILKQPPSYSGMITLDIPCLFYMILRADTMVYNSTNNTGTLDYLVFVTESLPEVSGSQINRSDNRSKIGRYSPFVATGSVVMLWLFLRFKTRIFKRRASSQKDIKRIIIGSHGDNNDRYDKKL